MSHSFACCAATTFSQAEREKRCAAAKFGCLSALIFSTGFWDQADPLDRANSSTAVIVLGYFMTTSRLVELKRKRTCVRQLVWPMPVTEGRAPPDNSELSGG